MYQDFVSQFKHQSLRDLAWVLSSPHLLSERAGVPLSRDVHCSIDERNAWLLALDKQPDALLHAVSQADQWRLGGYFEALLRFVLQQTEGVELLLNNWVVRDGKQTLGECDFVFRDIKRNQLHHWEVTVKFYLYHRGQFFGTNVRDRLDIKCQRLCDHQLILPQQPFVQALLKREFGIEQLESSAFFKGYLFYPLDFHDCTLKTLAADHPRGSWCHYSRLRVWCEAQDSDSRYWVVPRLQWLSGCVREEGEGVWDIPELLRQLSAHFQLHRQGQLVVALQRQGNDWHEVARCMVVMEGWPTV